MNKTESHKSGENPPIFLIGFMGAGKTTVGPVLAEKLFYEYRDLDSMIEAREGKTISAIFTELGEREFRLIERDVIESLRGSTAVVIALGGGAFVSEENRAILRSIGITVWLDCPLETCLTRVSNDQSRPLLGTPDEMKALFESRASAYARADYTVHIHDEQPDQIAAKILSLLNQAYGLGNEAQPEES